MPTYPSTPHNVPCDLRPSRRSIQGVRLVLAVFPILLLLAGFSFGQATAVEKGSQTAKGGFKNENEIRARFSNWRTDELTRSWLAQMGYDPAAVESVSASKPHGEKADVLVQIRLRSGGSTAETPGRRDQTLQSNEISEAISIKLVSSPNGFNQVDKRWLASYAKKWNMPSEVIAAMKLYLGEVPPNKPSRDKRRMFLNELEIEQQRAVIEFFAANKETIVSDLLEGDGPGKATRFMVAWKTSSQPRWTIWPIDEAVRFYSEGPVELTRAGNLKIGRVSMQRKGGDGGRETAKMLQFKLNPVQIFDAKQAGQRMPTRP